jgi:hypothetical protein
MIYLLEFRWFIFIMTLKVEEKEKQKLEGQERRPIL